MVSLQAYLKSLTLISLIFQLSANGWAQNYPIKPIRLVVSNSPGSNADLLARVIAPLLSTALGRQIFVDNRPGAGTTIGTEIVAKAPADGYTLLNVNMAAAVNESLYPNRNYNLVRDFAPVTQMVSSSSVLVVHPSVPVKSVSDLVKLATAKPGVINYGHAGVGSVTFLGAELFKTIADINMMAIPYRGGGEVVTALISGEVSVYFAPLSPVLPHIRRDTLRVLAVLNDRRLAALPQYPTIAEAGYPRYKCDSWYGLLAPVKTPKEIIEIIHKATLAVLNNPDVIGNLDRLGFAPVGNQPEELAALIKSEVNTWGEIARRTGMTAN